MSDPVRKAETCRDLVDPLSIRSMPEGVLITTDYDSASSTGVVSTHRRDSGVAVVRVEGELLSDAAADLTLQITDELHLQPPCVAIDLSAVTVIDAPGANALVMAEALARQANTSLHVHGVAGGPVEMLLRNLDLLDHFDIDTSNADPRHTAPSV